MTRRLVRSLGRFLAVAGLVAQRTVPSPRVCFAGALGVVFGFALGGPFSAVAQDHVDPPPARELFQQALGAIEQGRFAEASDLLEQSLELVPNRATMFNLGIALRGTGRLVEAKALFERLLDGEVGPLAQAERGQVRTLLEEIDEEVAELSLVIEAMPDVDGDAEVRLDGQPWGSAPRGQPWVRLIDPGSHVLTVGAAGMLPWEQTVELQRGEHRTVAIELEPDPAAAFGRLIVEVESPSDRVLLEDADRGDMLEESVGRFDRQLAPGTYVVRVEDEDGVREAPVEVEAGTTFRLRVARDSASVWESPWLWVGVGIAVAAGVAAAVIIPLTTEQERDPVTDPVYGVISTLRF